MRSPAKSGTVGRRVVTRHEAIDALRSTLFSLPVTAAAICGSFARNEQTAESDIDLFVSFERGTGIGDVEAARAVLERVTGRNADLITTGSGSSWARLWKHSGSLL